MKFLKLLLVAMATMVSLGAQAQEDITSTYLTNADLSSTDGWTISGQIEGTLATDGEVNTIEFYHTWSWNAGAAIGNSKDFTLSQTITLPAGSYRIAVNALYREGNGNGTNTKAYIFAGEKQQFVHAVTAAEQENLGSGDGAYSASMRKDDRGRAAYAFSIGDFSNAFDFDLAAETEITLGFSGYIDTYCSWCILGPVKLYKYSLEDYLVDYRAKYAEAEAISGKPMNADVQSALTAAMVDEASFSIVSQVTEAIATLTTAITNANNSISSYAAIKAVIDGNAEKLSDFDETGTAAYNTAAATAIDAYNAGTATDGAAEIAALKAAYTTGVKAILQPVNGFDMTGYITNPDFDGGNYNGWSTDTPYGGNCQIQGGSRMEYWAGDMDADKRALASFNIYQELSDLPAGVYTVSADMYNSLNGEGGSYTEFSPTCGVYGISSNEEVALVTEEGDILKTYTTGEILVFRGKMTIGTKNTVTPMAARWFLFDNVKLTYVRQLTQEEIDANTVPESISLDPASVDMTIYGTQTLTATILPANTNDKTVTWTSSDETVATVLNGVVTAVGIGSATITATANGADGVETTAEITVSDVTPVAAPSFYSEVAAGDFYIVNAATGKFLGGANSWGTHASIIEHGIPFTVSVSEGKYTLDSHTYNGETSCHFNGEWIDNDATNNLYIVAVGEGKYTISTADGSQYVKANRNSTNVDNAGISNATTLAQWYFLSKSDRDKMLAAATAENPIDATYYIKEANPSRNLKVNWSTRAWKGEKTEGGDNSNFNFMVENAAANVWQTIEGIPNGSYTLTMQGCTTGSAVLWANEQSVEILTNNGDITNQATASAVFSAGNYVNTIDVTVTNRQLSITVKSDDTDKQLFFDNFELYLKSYTPVTGVTAKIDQALVELGETAQITAATEPATASFNALTYTSSDEGVATVNANGVVTPVASGVATITIAANEMESFNTTVNVTVPVALNPGDDATSFITNPSFETGDLTGWIVGKSDDTGVKPNSNGTYTTEGCDGDYLFNTWWQGIPITQTVTALPKGLYELKALMANNAGDGNNDKPCLYLLANGEHSEAFSSTNAGVFAECSMQFYVTDGTATIGAIGGNADGSFNEDGFYWYKVDNFRLTFKEALPDINDIEIPEGKMSNAAAAAITAAKDAGDVAALIEAVEVAKKSIEAYAAAAVALTTANGVLNSTNVYSADARATYSEAIATAQAAYNNGSMDGATAKGLNNALSIAGWGATPAPASIDYITSAWTSTNDVLVGNFWSVEGDAEGASGMTRPFMQYWVDDNEKMADNTISASLTGLENGLYSVTAFVRVMNKKTGDDAGYEGISLAVNEGSPMVFAEAAEYPDGYAKEMTAEGFVRNGKLNITFTITGTNASWLAFKNVNYTKVRDLAPEEQAATEEDYEALNEAIAAKVIGFDEGEYAPYKNMEAIATLMAAKAFNQEAEHSVAEVQAVIATINNAAWTVNESEVNAIFDASFEHDYSALEGNVNPIGWQRVKDAAADGYNVRYMNGDNAGLAATTSGKALFTKTSAYYGFAEGYTMPLKANTYYKVAFVYGGWSDCKKDGYVTMLNPEGANLELTASELPLDAVNGHEDPDAWKHFEAVFRTGDAGDYVLGLRKKNESVQSQYAYGDFSLVRASVADIKTILQQAIQAAQTENAKYMVGEELFMYPDYEMEPLTTAIATATEAYNDAEATLESIAAAIEALNIAVDTFDPAIILPDEDKTYTFFNEQAQLYMTLSAEGISIAEEPCELKFEAAEDGKYYITDGTNYVGLAGTDDWSMSADAEKKVAITISAKVVEEEVFYTLAETKGLVGVDYPILENMGCWANKTAGDGDAVLWTIEVYETDVPVAVKNLRNTGENTAIYDLTGRKVEKMQRGIYILNGKKVSFK